MKEYFRCPEGLFLSVWVSKWGPDTPLLGKTVRRFPYDGSAAEDGWMCPSHRSHEKIIDWEQGLRQSEIQIDQITGTLGGILLPIYYGYSHAFIQSISPPHRRNALIIEMDIFVFSPQELAWQMPRRWGIGYHYISGLNDWLLLVAPLSHALLRLS